MPRLRGRSGAKDGLDPGRVKLLFDQNLSRRLVIELADFFPDSTHVAYAVLALASDADVWEYAAVNALVVVSKDADFHQLSLVRGAPPKVIWIRLGNSSTDAIAGLLRSHAHDIEAFVADSEAVFLALG